MLFAKTRFKAHLTCLVAAMYDNSEAEANTHLRWVLRHTQNAKRYGLLVHCLGDVHYRAAVRMDNNTSAGLHLLLNRLEDKGLPHIRAHMNTYLQLKYN